ncbi:uncharacterized protein LOC133034570 [Cannabis sativa]|uniref:uncharacterized protein LOC133034570 n=1 Tax=Cannabis sativa TaxID=3483 RepID=UPI0029CA841B|nr:uncharacterized protein LOC133034570 [Cannabis sativa]
MSQGILDGSQDYVARSTLQQWTAARVEQQGPLLVLSPHSDQVLWKKPALHTTKVNVDGAIFADERRYGFGCIARGADGKIIEAFSGSRFGVVGPEIAEVIGVKEALSWIKRKGWSKVEIETDSLVVVQAVTGSVQMPSQFGFLVQDCRNLLSCISHVSLHFVKRSANRAAHCLARASCYHLDRIVSEHTAPLELKSIVDVECL